MRVTVSRKAHFNAAHRLHVEDWSEDKNNEVLENVVIQITMVIIMNSLSMSLEMLIKPRG